MNGTELRKRLAEECGISTAQAAGVIEALTGIIEDELASGGNVYLRRFGKFHVAGYNREIKTPNGEVVNVRKAIPKFSASRALKEAVADADADGL